MAVRRIVSFSPAITEVLFALEVGDRVVGATRFCNYPPEAAELPRIGGYLDPNWEAVVALEPDLVVLMEAQEHAEARLQSLGIRVVRVDQHDVSGILRSITTLANLCDVPLRGRSLRESIEERLAGVRAVIEGRPKPRVLVSVGREPGSGTVTSLWAAGPETLYHEVLQWAGGDNVVESTVSAYPEISLEGLLRLDPDVILDVVADLAPDGMPGEFLADDWRDLGALTAVRTNRVHVLDQGFMVIPGPRVVTLVETVAKALHPEAAWPR